MPKSGDEHNSEDYKLRNNGAIHMHPEKARELIRQGAQRALSRFAENREKFAFLQLDSPFTKEINYRCDGAKPAYAVKSEHRDIINLLNS
jgi:D-aminopeptidase